MNQQTLLRTIVIGAVIAILSIVVLTVAKFEGMRTERDSYKSLADAQVKEVKYWQDKEGRSRAQAQAAEASTKSILHVHNTEMQDLRKQITGLNKNISNLKSYISTRVSTADTVFIPLRDTVYSNVSSKTFNYKDEWTSIDGLIVNDSVSLKYQVKDSLTFVTYYKKQGLFKPKLLMIDGISYNPNSRITGLKNITVAQPRPKRFSIGPYLGYDITRGVSIGIGVQYSVIRF
jgi:hypothetical protein